MRYLKLEVKKLLQEKLFFIFVVICLGINIGLCFFNPSLREIVNQITLEDATTYKADKIYDKLEGSELGKAYYNERYINSSVLNQWMKNKYDELQTAIDYLNAENADTSYYAGEVTPEVHEILFTYQMKGLLIECILLISLLCIKSFSMEIQNETATLIYSSKRGRSIAKDKILANGIIGMGYCTILIITSLIVFFCSWDFSNLWNANISSSFNRVIEASDAIYMKPFITWSSMTVKKYFVYSLLLIIGIMVVWWLISNMIALFAFHDLISGVLFASILFLPYFGLEIFPELHLTLPFYLSTLSLSTVIYYSQMWFTDLGHYSLVAYQEIKIVIGHLVMMLPFIIIGIKYFQRKKDIV